ncbi:MAG TPA: hypothetical protein VLB79_14795 [Solirubrobacterales bacterium]|nr:hypothetical protein [Solirubrobacterales bacterium]
MTDDQRFQLLQRLNEVDVAHVTADYLERFRSELRADMISPGHRPWKGLSFFKAWATPQAGGKSYWESHPESHDLGWEMVREIYTEWKMLEDDGFWTAVHQS